MKFLPTFLIVVPFFVMSLALVPTKTTKTTANTITTQMNLIAEPATVVVKFHHAIKFIGDMESPAYPVNLNIKIDESGRALQENKWVIEMINNIPTDVHYEYYVKGNTEVEYKNGKISAYIIYNTDDSDNGIIYTVK